LVAAITFIDICDCADDLLADESWTPTAKLKVPAEDGWPETTPEVELIPKPLGKAPLAIDH